MANGAASAADFCFVHFTDTHVMHGGVHPSTQVDTEVTLRQVVVVLQTLQPQPAFAVIGGDLASPDLLHPERTLTATEYVPSYRLLQDILRPLSYPVHMLLGNHDNRPAFHQVMQTGAAHPQVPHHYSFDHHGWHFVALDSLVPGEHGGRVDSDQLAWLRADLESHQKQPTLVFVHHHPLLMNHAWIDTMNLYNGADLVDVVRQFPNVRWIVCGHVHMDQTVEADGVTMLTTPSTCFQINRLARDRTPALSGPPAFRLVWIKGDNIASRVIYLHDEQLAAVLDG